MPFGPYFLGLPVDGNGLRYVDETSWNSVVGGQATWKENVNGGGYTLSNVILSLSPANIAAAQTPWLQNIDGGGFGLSNVATIATTGRAQFGANLGGTASAVDVHRATSQECMIRAHYGNVYEMWFGHDISGNGYAWSPNITGTVYYGTGGGGGVQIQTGAGQPRLVITAGGNVGIGLTDPSTKLVIRDGTDHNLAVLAYTTGMHIVSNSDPGVLLPLVFSASAYALLSFPSANPGAGTKQLWYDPADGNRVKYSP